MTISEKSEQEFETLGIDPSDTSDVTEAEFLRIIMNENISMETKSILSKGREEILQVILEGVRTTLKDSGYKREDKWILDPQDRIVLSFRNTR